MTGQRPSRPSLARARTLSERASLGQVPCSASARGEKRLARWQAQKPFDEGSRLADRLGALGLDEGSLAGLLSEDEESLAARAGADPAWMKEIGEAVREIDGADPVVPESVQGYAVAAGLRALWPIARRGRERLAARIAALVMRCPKAPFNAEGAVEMCYPALAPALVTMASRTMALELNVARLRGDLPEATPEERFASFFRRLATPEVTGALFEEYPVLARALVEVTARWVETSAELFERLCADFDALKETLWNGQDPGALVKIDGGLGDTHRGGRSVQLLTFSSGESVVYKPRSLAPDTAFQRLVGWLNEHGQTPALRLLRLLDRGEYGWVERLHAGPCETEEELRRFYERQGANLALLYALDAADFHHENVLAVGEHPMLIDLEVLLHPRFRIMSPVGSVAAAGGILDDSVLRIGLLPSRSIGGGGGRGADLGGLSGGGGQMTPVAVPQWEEKGTDRVHLGKGHVEIPAEKNRPTLRGAPVDVLDHEDAIVAGFERAYRILAAHKDELLAPDGAIGGFADVEVRAILRPTYAYSNLLTQSFHPDVLRDALDRDRYFDRLRVIAGNLPRADEVVEAEVRDLFAGDVPLFTTRPGTRDLFTSRGERIHDVFDEPSIEHVRRRVRGMGPEDLGRQVVFTRCSLATLRVGRDPAPAPDRDRSLPSPRTAVADDRLSEKLIAGARVVGDRLVRSAIRTGDQATWIGMTLQDDNYWMLSALDTDLYSGLSGVALFLGALGRVTGEERYRALARGAVASLTAQLASFGDRITNIGAFGGWGGIVYALTRLGVLWEDPTLFEQASSYVRRIEPLVAGDTGFDLVNGSAGTVLSLLGLHEQAPTAGAFELAIRCGERLIAAATPMDRGIAWRTPTPMLKPLCGMSHGSTGIALALATLGDVTGDARFTGAARATLEYEASIFSEEHANWPDYRIDLFPIPGKVYTEEDVGYMASWCHGATGMAHARLVMPAAFGPGVRRDIEIGIATTLREGFSRSHCLCHGDAGNLNFLADAARAFGDASLAEKVRVGAASLLEQIEEVGYHCGVPSGVEAPGLLAGTSGIGYGLLQLACPEIVPSVLTLGPLPREGLIARAKIAA
ncbi:MAG: type 2 lanthipeptide synthetase LanM family protein [Polyangiaceae bacterium]